MKTTDAMHPLNIFYILAVSRTNVSLINDVTLYWVTNSSSEYECQGPDHGYLVHFSTSIYI